MAKGTDTDETGLKREFAFAMNAQSESSGSLGRTGARKAEETNSDEKSSKKRVKICVSDNEETLISKEGEEIVIENGIGIVESIDEETLISKEGEEIVIENGIGNDEDSQTTKKPRKGGGSELKPIKCSECGIKKTCQWHLKHLQGKELCHRCYGRNKYHEMKYITTGIRSSPGEPRHNPPPLPDPEKCSECGTTETKQWHLKRSVGNELCNSCHLRRRKQKITNPTPSDHKETLISKEGEEVVIENGIGNVELLNRDEQKNDQLKCADEELVKSDFFVTKEEINSDGLNGETQVVVEKSPRRFTRSALKASEEESVFNSKKRNASLGKTKTRFTRPSLDSVAAEMLRDDNKESGNDSMETPEKTRFTCSSLDSLAAEMVSDDAEDTVMGTSDKLDKLLTCSALDHKTDEMLIDDDRKVEISLAEKPSSDIMEHVAPSSVIPENSHPRLLSLEKPGNCITDSALETKPDDLIMDDREVQKSSVKKSPNQEPKEQLVAVTENSSISTKRFPRVALEVNQDLVVSPTSNQLNVLSEKPTRRFTRSLLEREAEPTEIIETYEQKNVTPEKSMKRFTRSLLAAKLEHEVIDHSNEPHNGVSEEAPRRFTRSALKPKEERIGTSEHVSTNSPSNVQELFETGMLEGLVVKYDFPGKKTIGLGGTIKELGILCSCNLCKGEKVVTPCQFEQHAGGTSEHPAEYIYLENDRSLKEVLDFLKDIPLEKLEATVQSAISTVHVKNTATCMYCKGPLPGSKRVVQLCYKCLETRGSGATPSHKTGAERSRSVVTPKSLKNIHRHTSPQNTSSAKSSVKGKITRKDLGLHKLVFEEGGLPDGTELAYYMNGKKLLEGYKKGFGIFCRCCDSEVSASGFEAHAGYASRRKPYLNIYTSNGVSLHELSISLSKARKFITNYNDDLCGICADFGDLLLCDGCPRAFHRDCVGELRVPRGDWYCPYCLNMFQRENHCASNANALAAGRVEGVDVIEQITKRCIRIAETTEPEVGGGCSLCRCPGFSKSEFGPRTVIICDQCQKEFHVGCLKDHKMADLEELPKGDWFCCTDCSRLHTALQKLIIRGSEKLPDSLLAVVKEKLAGKGLNMDEDLDVRWRLLSGETASPDSRSLLSKAVAIFHDRFDPIVDAISGRDLIPAMIYGRNNKIQDYGGMYCAVLTINSSVVTAGILRIFGQELAELPLVATSSDYQGQGYFQSLFCCLERLLGFLKVKNLVLPSAREAESIWTDKFGFEKVGDDKLKEYKKDYQMAIFQGTTVLQKAVPKCRIIDRSPIKS